MGIEFKIPWYQKPLWWALIALACIGNVCNQCWQWAKRQVSSKP